MTCFAGVDVSSRAIDVVLLDEDTDRARHVRRRLDFDAGGALSRIRRIRDELPPRASWLDEGVAAVWIERPFARGNMRGQEPLLMAIGGLLQMIPAEIPLDLVRADDWRKTCGLPIRGKRADLKRAARAFAIERWVPAPFEREHLADMGARVTVPLVITETPRLDDDSADAFCIAWACRKLEQTP